MCGLRARSGPGGSPQPERSRRPLRRRLRRRLDPLQHNSAKMMDMAEDTNRSANSTIAGYRYQFDLTILEILSAGSSEVVTIEGVEDIDKNGVDGSCFVQCKYLTSRKYSLASLRSSLIPMLASFGRGLHSKYYVHAHFGKETSQVPETLTVSELKESLTEYRRDTGEEIIHYDKYEDSTLEDFVKSVVIREGKDIEGQKREVLAELTSAMMCSREETVGLHYGNALTFVSEKACQKDISSRKVTREEFLKQLDRKPLLYTIWHREVASLNTFVKETARRLSALKVLSSKKNRVLYVEHSLGGEADSLLDTTGLITFLALDDYGKGRLYTARPWTVVVRSSSDGYRSIKRDLIERGVAYCDGYEDVLFSSALFHRDPVIVRQKRGDLIETTSYDIRLMSEESFDKYIKEGYDFDAILSAVESVDSVPASKATFVHISGLHAERIVSLLAEVK